MQNQIQVVRIEFDNKQKVVGDARVEEIIATFVDDSQQTAYKKANQYVPCIPPPIFYLGYDYQVYPQILVRRQKIQ